jgi:hypothetical protein
MVANRRFRILTPDGLLSPDTFLLPAEQPHTISEGCVLVIDERSGILLTVHQTRLFPAETAPFLPVVDKANSPCLRCGRVRGVVEDQVACPEHGGAACGMVEPSKGLEDATRPAT